jgi:putative endonuclease
MRDSPNLRRASEARGRAAEARAEAALTAEGFATLARRARTAVGEIDLVVERQGLLVFVEVKARATLKEAAFALGARQQARLLAAGEAWMAVNPGHGETGVRFDVLLVDAEGRVRRVADALRQG